MQQTDLVNRHYLNKHIRLRHSMEDDVLGNANSVDSSTTMKDQDPTLSPKAEDMKDNAAENTEEEKFKICSPNTKRLLIAPKIMKDILKPPLLRQSSLNPVIRQSSLNPVCSMLQPKPQQNNCDNSSNLKNNQTVGEVLKFVPLIKTEVKPDPQNQAKIGEITQSTTSAPKFVFGQNLQERVVADKGSSNDTFPSSNQSNAEEEPSTNGTSTALLFSSAIKNDTGKDSKEPEKEGKSLSDSAREYEEQRGAGKRKYEKVEVKTGEEEETNVLNMGCKLFAFDNDTSNWKEIGRGTLRLNDFEGENDITQSRLVFRTAGSLKVILNTKIWAKMTVEKASEKSVRLTALDSNGDVKVFLIMSNIDDTIYLYNLLRSRLQLLIDSQKKQKLDDVSIATMDSTTSTS